MHLSFLVLVWTAVAIVLHCSDVGVFATWDVTAWPWHWSCCCILWLYLCLLAIVIGVWCGLRLFTYWRKERIINSYAPEQREFIRRLMERD